MMNSNMISILIFICLSVIVFFIWFINYQLPKGLEELEKKDNEWADKMRKEGISEKEIQTELYLLQNDPFII